MDRLPLCSLRQDCDQRWLWFGIFPGTDRMIVSRQKWEDRSQAQAALSRFLDPIRRNL